MKNLLLNLGLFWGISIFLMIALEFISRFIFPEWAPSRAERVSFWQYDSLLGWAHSPNQIGIFSHSEFRVEVKINSHGLRDDDYAFDRTPGKSRLLVLGDSYSWGFGVEKEEIFTEILERKWSQWEIVNTSVSGYGTDQEYLYFKHRGRNYHPDVVLLVFHPNDFENNTRKEEYWYYKPVFDLGLGDSLELFNVPVPPASFSQKFSRFVQGKTYLGSKFSLLIARLSNLIYSGTDILKDSQNLKTETAPYLRTLKLLQLLNQEVQDCQARLVVISIPMEIEYKKKKFDYQRLLSDFLARENIPYLSLEDAFAGRLLETTFRNDPHWNKAGQELAAEKIEFFLSELGIFKDSAPATEFKD